MELLKQFKNRQELLWIAIFSCFTLCIFPPCELYLSNINEFWFSFRNILPIICILTGLVFLVIVLIGNALPMRLYHWFCTLVFSSTIAAYIQGNFLNNNYGVLDGKEVYWENYQARGIISLATWIVVIAGIFFLLSKLKNYKKKIIKWVVFVLIAMQMSAMIFLILNKVEKETNQFAASEKNLFTYSEEENIVVLILDTFDSNVFRELLEQYPKFKDIFKDFTFYKNTVGMYPTTKASIPYMLTGIPYENQEPYTKYLEKAYDETKLFSVLEDNKYEYNIYTKNGVNDTILQQSSNGIEQVYEISSYSNLGILLYKASLFKYVPQQIKPHLWSYTGDFDDTKKSNSNIPLFSLSNFSFIDNMKGEWEKVSKKQFKFIHLSGLHSPYNMNESMNKEGDITYLEHAAGVGNMAAMFLDKLKELGVYNNSSIIILADHGTTPFSEYSQAPLFLTKLKGETGALLEENELALSFANLQEILLQEIEGFADVSSIVQTSFKNKSADRRYLYYYWDDKWDADYMPAMHEYLIKGDVNDTSQIIKSGNIYTSETPKLRFDEELLFYGERTANDYFVQGLHIPSKKATWSKGRTSIMRAKTDVKDKDIYVKLSHSATSGRQNIVITLKDNVLYEGEVQGNGVIYFDIERDLVKEEAGNIEIQIHYQKASTEKLVELTEHSVEFTQMQFSNKPFPYEKVLFDEELTFQYDFPTANKYFTSGLSAPEKKYTWTDGVEAEMDFYADSKNDIMVSLAYSTVYHEPQRLKISLEDCVLFEETLGIGEGTIELRIPYADLKELDGNIRLRFTMPDAISPKDLKESGDARKLCIALKKLFFSKYNEKVDK